MLPLHRAIDFAGGVGWFHPNIEKKVIQNTEKPSSPWNTEHFGRLAAALGPRLLLPKSWLLGE